jgi:hypothetical protein
MPDEHYEPGNQAKMMASILLPKSARLIQCRTLQPYLKLQKYKSQNVFLYLYTNYRLQKR